MHGKLVPTLALTVIAATTACDSDSPTMPAQTPATTSVAPPPAPVVPADAVIALTGTFECVDPFCDFAEFMLNLVNSGGVGANLNFVRVENRNAQPVLELGADHFINAFGSNRLEAGETLDFFLVSQLGYVVIVGYRDDNGNIGEAKYFPDLPR